MDRVLRSDLLQANPAARHARGRAARACVEAARLDVARLIGAAGEEIIWTSGATESNNLAVIGAARFRAGRGRHLVTCVTEHPSVTAAFRHLATQGFAVTWLEPGIDGILPPEQVAAALRPDTTVVSVMHVNNETGVVQDVAAIGALCRSRGVLFHVDAVQAAGRERIDAREQGIDLLSLSAHKMYGPKGVGALYVSMDTARRVEPLLFGGGQERGMRPGTVATHQVVGMGVAARLAGEHLTADSAGIRLLRDELWTRLGDLPGVLLNGHPTRRACHILNVSVIGVEGESLLYGLRDLAVSAGSACASGDGEPSAVLRCLGRSDELARSSVRFSLGRGNTLADVDCAADRFSAAVAHLRRLSPATPG
ncbi:MAG: aminotransferase class V-fold PLP-dependent enzyme [Gammaproteobacteria bacterium]|nr:aminotransferase class V-fold PLP-dependent enzyme [Gammaproteobacteria bacterium]